MPTNAKSLGIDLLSLGDRMVLVEEIWDSIAAESASLEVPQSHKEELDRRLADFDSDPHSGSSWEDVENRLQK